MNDQELERRVTLLAMKLGQVLDTAPVDVLAKAMSEFPALLTAELRQVEGIGMLEALCDRAGSDGGGLNHSPCGRQERSFGSGASAVDKGNDVCGCNQPVRGLSLMSDLWQRQEAAEPGTRKLEEGGEWS